MLCSIAVSKKEGNIKKTAALNYRNPTLAKAQELKERITKKKKKKKKKND